LSAEGEPFGISCKLPQSSQVALMLPQASPTAYGLGKSGWVTLQLGNVPARDIDVDMLKSWIDESYRAQAPRKLVKELDARAGAGTKPEPKKAARKKG